MFRDRPQALHLKRFCEKWSDAGKWRRSMHRAGPASSTPAIIILRRKLTK